MQAFQRQVVEDRSWLETMKIKLGENPSATTTLRSQDPDHRDVYTETKVALADMIHMIEDQLKYNEYVVQDLKNSIQDRNQSRCSIALSILDDCSLNDLERASSLYNRRITQLGRMTNRLRATRAKMQSTSASAESTIALKSLDSAIVRLAKQSAFAQANVALVKKETERRKTSATPSATEPASEATR